MLWLFGQILFCLLLAGLLGLLLGWLVWGRRAAPEAIVRTNRTALAASNARTRDLERDLADCRARVSTAPVAPLPISRANPPVAALAPLAPEPPAPASSAAAPAAGYGLFGPVSHTTVDNLTAISGVDPVVETQLARIGITTYRQIARLDAADVLRVHEAIDVFPGRIEREGWVEQASRLHREAYGTAP